MKSISILKNALGAFMLCTLLLLQSCSQTEESIDVTDPVSLELSSSTLEFDYNGNSIDELNGKIEVSSNRWWEVVFDSESNFSSWGWSIDYREAEDDGAFTISVPKSYDARQLTATVKVYNQKGELISKTVEITQHGIADPVDAESTISDVVSKLTDESSFLSEEYNYYFQAAVTAFAADGTMFVQSLNATTPNNGIAINATVEEALNATYAVGDVVKVTIPAMTGRGIVVNAAPQLVYSTLKLEKESTTEITPVAITAAELKSNDFVNMYVAISDATPENDGGIWTDGENDGMHTFNVSGDTFTLFVSKNEADMYKVPFSKKTGAATGIAGSSVVNGQLIVSTQSQVTDFAFTDPVITAITPEKHEFYAEGGSQEFVLGGTNLLDQEYTVTGLGSEFTYTIDNTVAKPVITISTVESFVASDIAEQTVTISTADQEISFTVSQKAGELQTGLASNATSSSIDVSGSVEFVDDFSSVTVGIEYASSSDFADATKVSAPSSTSQWLMTIDGLTASTQYYFRAYIIAGEKTIYGEGITASTVAAGSDIPFKTIPEALATIKTTISDADAAGTTPANKIVPYAGETFKVRGIVTSDFNSHNTEPGFVYIATEGSTNAGEGICVYVGWYDNHVKSIANLAMGDEVIITLKTGVGMYNAFGAPYISTWNNANVTFEETGRTNVMIEPIVIDAANIADYYSQLVTIKNVTIATAGKFDNHNKNFWITDAGVAVRVGNQASSIFKGVTYNAATGDLTGIAFNQAGATVVLPRNYFDFSDFLDASYLE